MRSIKNPNTATGSGTTGGFLFESMKEGVFTVKEYENVIPGVSITPGLITDASVVGFALVQNFFADYTVKFLPMNTVPKGGAIKVVFPATY